MVLDCDTEVLGLIDVVIDDEHEAEAVAEGLSDVDWLFDSDDEMDSDGLSETLTEIDWLFDTVSVADVVSDVVAGEDPLGVYV